MSKDEFLKIQTCVLKVNIHCDGCKKKVKKILQKIDGVYTIKIDAEQGKVMVSGNVDPATLVKKLIKNGKHAEIMGASKPQNNFQSQINDQFKNLMLDNGKGGNNKNNNNKANVPKGDDEKPKGGGLDQLKLLQQLQQMKGFQDLKPLPLNKDHNQKSVKLNLPEDEDLSDDEFDDDDDYDDEEYDDDDEEEDDDDEEEEEVEDAPLDKMKPGGGDGRGGSFLSNLMKNSQNLVKGGGDNGGGNAKKGGGGQNDAGGNGGKKGGSQSQGDGKGGGAQPKDVKNGGGGGKNDNHGGSGATNGKIFMPNGAKKSGVMNDETRGIPNMINMNSPIGQIGNIPTRPVGGLPAVQGLPALNTPTGGGGGGYFHGGGPEHMAGNPYHSQQVAAMMMNQRRANGNESFQPMIYARPPPAVNYMPSYLPYPYPPPPGERIDQYSMFSDENTSACTIM